MLTAHADEWFTLKDDPNKGTLVEVDLTRNVVRKTQTCNSPNEALAFQCLLKHLMTHPDDRLVLIRSVTPTDEGYVYEMDWLGKGSTRAENLLVELYGEREEGSLKIEDEVVLARLADRLPKLTQFLDRSLKFYFDFHGLNLRRTDAGYKWIDAEGLHWLYTSDGRVFLAGELICENYQV